eukprot:3232432-Prymnesium_polylepis.1
MCGAGMCGAHAQHTPPMPGGMGMADAQQQHPQPLLHQYQVRGARCPEPTTCALDDERGRERQLRLFAPRRASDADGSHAGGQFAAQR